PPPPHPPPPSQVSKMGGGAAYAHVFNMMAAKLVSNNVRAGASLADECAWYGMNFLIDTTLGLALSVLLLWAVAGLAVRNDWTTLKTSGDYSGENGIRTWRNQFISWLVILSVTKVVLTLLLWWFSPFFAAVGGFLFAPIQSNEKFELIFVMILFPGALNVLYFWAADSFLKAEPKEDDGIALVDMGAARSDDPMELGLKDPSSTLLGDTDDAAEFGGGVGGSPAGGGGEVLAAPGWVTGDESRLAAPKVLDI
ncbi:hypothetical protein TeGR_g1104, partial [Tetraparma gracilis]